jgi:pimeloyl-ACP methyl ester carboxylesterase
MCAWRRLSYSSELERVVQPKARQRTPPGTCSSRSAHALRVPSSATDAAPRSRPSRISADSMGDVSRRIIFLPGVSGDGRFWKPVAKRLPGDYEKVLVDWPGLGDVPTRPAVRSRNRQLLERRRC